MTFKNILLATVFVALPSASFAQSAESNSAKIDEINEVLYEDYGGSNALVGGVVDHIDNLHAKVGSARFGVLQNRAVNEAQDERMDTIDRKHGKLSTEVGENGLAIKANTKAIGENKDTLGLHYELIAANKNTTAANRQIIDGNGFVIDANTQAIADNAKQIERNKKNTYANMDALGAHDKRIKNNMTAIINQGKHDKVQDGLIADNAAAIAGNSLVNKAQDERMDTIDRKHGKLSTEVGENGLAIKANTKAISDNTDAIADNTSAVNRIDRENRTRDAYIETNRQGVVSALIETGENAKDLGYIADITNKQKVDEDGNPVWNQKTVFDENGEPVIDPDTGLWKTEDDLTSPVIETYGTVEESAAKIKETILQTESNTKDIEDVVSKISNAFSRIDENATLISGNTEAIKQNSAAIAHNAGRIDALEGEIDSLKGGVAMAIAIANAPIVSTGENKFSLSGGMGYYEDAFALSLKAAFMPTDRIAITGSIASDMEESFSAGAGIGIGF